MNDRALSVQCSSYGSDGCPCALSILKECLVCSHLQGKELCDCNWNKYCVYINFIHDRKCFQKSGRDYSVPVRVLNMGKSGLRVFLTAPDPVLDSAGVLRNILLKERPAGNIELPAVVLATYPDHGLISLAINPTGKEAADGIIKAASFDLFPGNRPAVGGLGLNLPCGRDILVVAEDFGQQLVDALVEKCLPPGSRATVIMTEDLPLISRKLRLMSADCRVTGPVDGGILAAALREKKYHACFSLGSPRLHRKVNSALDFQGKDILHFSSEIYA